MAQNIISSDDISHCPPALSTNGDLSKNWCEWRQNFISFLKKEDPTGSSKHHWGKYLLMFIGPAGIEANKKISFDQISDKENFDVLIQKFDLYFIFGSRTIKDTESIDDYVDNLMHLAISSKYTEVQNIVKEKIILDMVREEFKEGTQASIRFTSKNLATDLRALTLNEVILSWKNNKSSSQNKSCWKKEPSKVSSEMTNCVRCGTNHLRNKCPAYGIQCTNCKMFNHFTEKCTTMYIHDCPKCGSSHAQSRCKAFGHTCSKCGKCNHFTWKCKLPVIKNCIRCGTDHVVSRCPAQGKMCPRCKKPNHLEEKCISNIEVASVKKDIT